MGYLNPTFLGGSGGGISPSDNINITGTWTASDPTIPQQLATKSYVDSHSSSGSAIQLWSNTTSYAVGNFVYVNNSIWCCKVANTNSTPSLTNNNWGREADLDSSVLRVATQSISSNYTWVKGVFCVRVANLTADTVVTLSTISSFSDSSSTGKMQEFILIKADNNKNLALVTSSPDTFSDGTTNKVVSGNTIIRFFLDYTSSTWRF